MKSTRSRPTQSSIAPLIALAVALTVSTAVSDRERGPAALSGPSGPLGPNVLLGPAVRPWFSLLHQRRHVTIAASETASVAAWPVPHTVGRAPALGLARSLDGGVTWMAPTMVVNAEFDGLPAFAVHSPALATDGAGRWIAVWLTTFNQSNSVTKPIFSVSTDDGATWSEPASVSSGTAPSSIRQWPSVAWLGDETWMIVGQSFDEPGNVRATRSLDDGHTWLTETAIASSMPGAGVALASDGAGQAMIGWRGSGLLRAVHSDDAGETWSMPTTIAAFHPGETQVHFLSLAHDGVSGFVAAWHRYAALALVGVPDTVETSTSVDGQQWIEASVVDRLEPGESIAHATLAGANGRAVIAWASTDSRVMGTDFDIFAVESEDGGLTWSERRVVNAGGRGDGTDQLYPAVAATATGWVAVWATEPGRAADAVRTVSARGFGVDPPCQVGRGDDCDGDLSDDACAIALGWLDDCAGLGIPQGCAAAVRLAMDCDGDGVPDACSIAAGAADDCDGDNVPDACQLAGYAHAVNNSIWWYITAGFGDWTTLERFDRRPGVDVLTAVQMRVTVQDPSAPGTALLCIWSDPVGDGNPVDANLMASVEFVPNPDPVLSMQTVEITPIDLTTLPTARFFVGVITTRTHPLVTFVEGQPTSRAGTAFFGFTPPGQTDPSDLLHTASLSRLTAGTIHYGLWAIAKSSHDLNGDGVIDACQLAGDLDGDGVVDGADLGILLLAWGSAGGPSFADLNGDGVVDGVDLGLLAANWGAE